MVKTISPQDMQEMERAFMDGTGYPSVLLMEHAAQAVVRELKTMVSENSCVLFVCGGGNNGGDGCAAARLWTNQGGKAIVWMIKGPSQMHGDAGMNARLLSSCSISQTLLCGELPDIPSECQAVVDALFGTGLSRPLEGTSLDAVRKINSSGLPILSVDIPSGVDGSNGYVLGDAVRADMTVTFHRPKHGHLLFPGRALTGKLIIEDIGILTDWDGAQGYEVPSKDDIAALLPNRAKDGHKGTFGHVLVVAGSEGMAGAACLCSESALKSGCGLVTAACCLTIMNTLQNRVPCAMAKSVSYGQALDAEAADELRELAKGKDALAIGPGLGQNEDTWLAIKPLIESSIPKVIDADALNMLSIYGGKIGENSVLTPHIGEMGRLSGLTNKEVLSAPIDAAQQLAAEHNVCVLLKGATTVIACGEDLSMNITGSDAMSTGGSGDVLTGIIASLLAQGMNPWDAARAGAYYHGLSGEKAESVLGARAVTALDIVANLRIE